MMIVNHLTTLISNEAEHELIIYISLDPNKWQFYFNIYFFLEAVYYVKHTVTPKHFAFVCDLFAVAIDYQIENNSLFGYVQWHA